MREMEIIRGQWLSAHLKVAVEDSCRGCPWVMIQRQLCRVHQNIAFLQGNTFILLQILHWLILSYTLSAYQTVISMTLTRGRELLMVIN